MAKHYNRVIFVGADNLCESIMAEAIMKRVVGDRPLEVLSRGLVVFFPEPVNQKAVEVLEKHGLSVSKEYSEGLEATDIVSNTLILTMKESQSHKILTNFLKEDQAPEGCDVYGLMGFAGQNGESITPSGDLESYEQTFILLDMWVKVAAQKILENIDAKKAEEPESKVLSDIEQAVQNAYEAAVAENMNVEMLEIEDRRRKEREAQLREEYLAVVEKIAAREAAKEVTVSDYKLLYQELKEEKEKKDKEEES